MATLRPFLRPLRSLRSPQPTIRTFTTTPLRPLAKISILGRLAAEPELVPTSTGTDVVRYAVGTSHGPRDNKQTSWWKVGAFMQDTPARELLMGLGKGSLIYVEGDCNMAKFQTKDGNQANSLRIVQRTFEVLEKRDGEGLKNMGSASEESPPEGTSPPTDYN